MKHILLATGLALSLSPMLPQEVSAGPIDRACMTSDRKARSARLCGCIQQVADQTLSRADQRRGAKFFKQPQLAQDTRQSDNSSHEAFWQRWKQFGATAAASCN